MLKEVICIVRDCVCGVMPQQFSNTLTSDGFNCIVFHAYSTWEHVGQKLASGSLIEYLHLSKWSHACSQGGS